MPPPTRPLPIRIPAAIVSSDPAHSAVFIFLHGLGDDASGLENLPHQFSSVARLPHLSYTLPSAPNNHELAQPAWFFPTRLSAIPSSRPELDDPEDEAGVAESVAYIVSLIDDQIAAGTPANRIVVGGFSQGAAVALHVGLASNYRGRLAGLVVLSGFLPLAERVGKVEQGEMEVFLARGTADRLVPKRYARIVEEKVKGLRARREWRSGSLRAWAMSLMGRNSEICVCGWRKWCRGWRDNKHHWG